MPYTPDPTLGTAPLDTEQAKTAAAEFRALKSYIQATIIAGLALKAPLTGVGATGTWPINVSGNAATATSATSATTAVSITGSGYNGYGTRTVSNAAPSGGADGDIWYQY